MSAGPLTIGVLLIAARFEESAGRAARRGEPHVALALQDDARLLRALVQAHDDLRTYCNLDLATRGAS